MSDRERFGGKPVGFFEGAADGRTAIPKLAEMIAALVRIVIGQEAAAKSLVTAIYVHLQTLKYAMEKAESESPTTAIRKLDGFLPARILITGPPGSGKTLLVKTLARMLDLPFVYVSATALTKSGYVGRNLEEFLAALVKIAGSVERAENGILFIDDVDKLRKNQTPYIDVSGEGVQQDLLALIEGAPVLVPTDTGNLTFDTTKTIIIAAGAFVGLEEQIRRRHAPQPAFDFTGPEETDSEGTPPEEVDVTPQDLVNFGLMEEFVGRFPVITRVNALTKDDLRRILTSSEGSILKGLQSLFEGHSVDLDFSESAIETYVQKALNEGMGARALSRIVRESLTDALFRLPDLAAQGMTRAVVRGEQGEISVSFHRRAPSPIRKGISDVAPLAQDRPGNHVLARIHNSPGGEPRSPGGEHAAGPRRARRDRGAPLEDDRSEEAGDPGAPRERDREGDGAREGPARAPEGDSRDRGRRPPFRPHDDEAGTAFEATEPWGRVDELGTTIDDLEDGAAEEEGAGATAWDWQEPEIVEDEPGDEPTLDERPEGGPARFLRGKGRTLVLLVFLPLAGFVVGRSWDPKPRARSAQSYAQVNPPDLGGGLRPDPPIWTERLTTTSLRETLSGRPPSRDSARPVDEPGSLADGTPEPSSWQHHLQKLVESLGTQAQEAWNFKEKAP